MTSSLSSMTGFARASGSLNGLGWAWEARSVNGKSLDVRLRLPAAFERLDQQVRALASSRFKRGSLQISLQVQEPPRGGAIVVNENLLETLKEIAEKHSKASGGQGVDMAQLLNIRGVVELVDAPADDAVQAAQDAALLAGLNTVLNGLVEARNAEGARLAAVLADQIGRIETLTFAARDNPARKPEAIRQRLSEQVQRLMDGNAGTLDAARLHQEAMLLAAKADTQEEIDRILSHVTAARKLLSGAEAAGRKLDFLVQEFNREANTLCSKSPDASLTAIGLELKLVIDQVREQVQNVE